MCRAERRPRHVAIIMDGNGRWAQRQHLPRIEGHRRGVASVRRTVEEAARLHLDQLTLYCLSSENWKRPQRELDFLMHLLEQYMIEERSTIMRQNITVRVIGRREGIPAATLAEMDTTVEMSAANTGTRLCLAINYGGRGELVDAVRQIASEAQSGQLDPATIDEADDRRPALHRRHARPGSADPHGRRDADQQLPALADQLRGAVGHGALLAGVRRSRSAPGDSGLCGARPTVRRDQVSGDTLLRWRLISAAVILAVLLTLVWLDFRQAVFGVPGVWLLPVLLAVSLLAAEEVLSLVGGKDLRPVAWVIYLGTALINLAAALPMFYQFFGWKLAADSPLGRFGWPMVMLALASIGVLIAEMQRYRAARPVDRDSGGRHLHAGLCRPARFLHGAPQAARTGRGNRRRLGPAGFVLDAGDREVRRCGGVLHGKVARQAQAHSGAQPRQDVGRGDRRHRDRLPRLVGLLPLRGTGDGRHWFHSSRHCGHRSFMG